MILGACLAVAGFSSATPLTWDTDSVTPGAQGGGGTWANGTNNWWNGTANAAWNNATPDTATFAGSAGTVGVDAAGITTGGITFSTAGYVIGGTGTLTLNGALVTNVNATINAPVVLGSSQTWTTTSARQLEIGGLLDLGANTLTISGANTGANYRFIGGSTGSGGITKNGTGVLYMGGNHNHSGQTVVGSGYLEVSGGALNMPNSVLNITSGDTRAMDIWAGKVTVRGLTGTGQIAANGAYNNGAGWWWTTSTDKVALSMNVPAAESYTFGGILKNATWSGSVMTIEKTGSGTQVLSGANIFTGAMLVNGGTLRITGTLRNTSGATVKNGAILELGATNIFVGGHGIAVDNARVLTADGGTVLFNGSMDSRIGNLAMRNGGTVTSNRGLGAWDVLLANTSTGAASVTVSNTAGNTAPATMNGSGGIHLQGAQNFVVDDVTGDTAADLVVTMVLGDGGLAGGTGALTKTGSGTLELGAANTYTGATLVNGGTLRVSGSIQSATTVAPAASLALNGSPVLNAAITIQPGGLLDTSSAATWSPAAGTTLTAGRVTAPATDIEGNLRLGTGANLRIGAGSGTMATLTTSGGLTLGGGKITIDLPDTVAEARDGISAGGTLDLAALSELAFNLTELKLDSGVYPLISAAGISGDPATMITTTGLPAGPGSRQTFTLSTTTIPNTLTLDVIGSGAILIWNNANLTGVWNDSDFNWNNTGLDDKFYNGDITRFEDTASPIEVITLDGILEPGSITATNTTATAYQFTGLGQLVGATGLAVTGGGTLDLANSGGNSFTGAILVNNASTLRVGAAGALPAVAAVTLDNGTLDIGGLAVNAGSITLKSGATIAGTTGTLAPGGLVAEGGMVSANLAGAGSFTITNGGTVGLDASTSLTAPITIQAGCVLGLLDGAAVTGNVNNAGSLRGNPASGQSASVNGIISGAGDLQQNGPGTLVLAGAQTFSGATTVNAGTLDLATSDGRLYTGAYRTTTLTINSGGTVRAGRINYSSANHLGELTHNSPNNVINGGTLELVSAADTSARGWTIGAAGATIRTAAGSTHEWAGGNNWTQIDLNNAGASIAFDIGGQFTLKSAIMDYTGTPGGAGGVSISNGSVSKSGPGTLVLGPLALPDAGGSHKYSGVTSILQGTLRLDANLGTSPVVVSAGAVLVAGTGIATLGCGPLTLAAGATLELQIQSDGATADRLNAAGNVDLAGATLALADLGGTTLAPGTKLTVLGYTGTLAGTFAGLAEGGTVSAGSNTFTIAYNDGGAVTLTAVAAGGFASWIPGFATNGQDEPQDDPDNDGLPNAVEYVLGGSNDPGVPSRANAPVSSIQGNNLVFSFTRRDAAESGDVTVSVEAGPDLATWPDVFTIGIDNTSSSPEVDIDEAGAADDIIHVTIPMNGATEKFARLRVVVDP